MRTSDCRGARKARLGMLASSYPKSPTTPAVPISLNGPAHCDICHTRRTDALTRPHRAALLQFGLLRLGLRHGVEVWPYLTVVTATSRTRMERRAYRTDCDTP